jgi:hypothetical protein
MVIEADLVSASHFAVESMLRFEAFDPDSFLAGRMALTVVSAIDGRVIRIGQPGEPGVFVHSETRRKVVDTVQSERNHQILKACCGNTRIINIRIQNGKRQRSQVEDLSFLRLRRGKRFPSELEMQQGEILRHKMWKPTKHRHCQLERAIAASGRR